MTVKELKAWCETLDERSVIQQKKYGYWEPIDPLSIRAHLEISVPMPALTRTMEEVCNLEDAT